MPTKNLALPTCTDTLCLLYLSMHAWHDGMRESGDAGEGTSTVPGHAKGKARTRADKGVGSILASTT